MVFLDTLYRYNREISKNVQNSLNIKGLGRMLIRISANTLIPLLFKLIPLSNSSKPSVPIIISLTSFPARIKRVWITIQSLLRQQYRPEKIILWLSNEQFPNSLNSLPADLIKLQSKGLEIRFVNGDVKSFKKFYYAFREYPNEAILTVDDDLIFPSTFIRDIYFCQLRHPNSVIANFGFKFHWDDDINYMVIDDSLIKEEETGKHLFFGSGGGTLFKPLSLMPYLNDINEIITYCPTADDIYLNSLCRLAGMDVCFMTNTPLLSIWNKGDVKLCEYNGGMADPNSKNAEQLRNVISFTNKQYNKNPFKGC